MNGKPQTSDELKIDENDLKILKILEEDSKTNYREISKRVKIAIGTVSNRIKKLTDLKVIKKFTIDIDTRKIGYEITAIILLQILGKAINEVEEILSKNPNVYVIYNTTGDWGSIIAVKFKHIHELNQFLKTLNKIEQIERTSTSVCLNVIKENTFFPIQL
ncbi:MAG: Lrp/AsnC family transcriptional regulator [Candidatus Helarchaeota archaeon]